MNSSRSIERSKIIWSFWDSGLKNSPKVIQVCNQSWVDQNSGWEVRFLDNQNLTEFLSTDELLPKSNYPSIQKYSNHVRLMLLKKYGGVWVDADVLCLKPLDGWLHEAATQGLFMFSNPTGQRVIANWFIYSSVLDPRSQACIEAIEESYRCYFERNNFRRGRISVAFSFTLERVLNLLFEKLSLPSKIGSSFWNSFFTTKLLRLTPYFSFHYIVENLIYVKPPLMQALIAMKNLEASGPLQLRRFLKTHAMSEIPKPWFGEEQVLAKLNYRQLTDSTFSLWSAKLR